MCHHCVLSFRMVLLTYDKSMQKVDAILFLRRHAATLLTYYKTTHIVWIQIQQKMDDIIEHLDIPPHSILPYSANSKKNIDHL